MSNLILTKKIINEAKTTSDLFEIEAFKNSFISNYHKTTDKQNGEMVYERERVLFLEMVVQNPKLDQCDNFSKYRALIQLGASGLSLNDGQCYIIPKGSKASFQIGWKGRLYQIGMLENVLFVNPAQVVYQGDDFDLELGESPKIIKHKPCARHERQKDESGRFVIDYVYLYITFSHGKELYMMDRDEVLNIRDRRSDSYKFWSRNNGVFNGRTLDEPMWVSDEPQAFRKTLVKRAWGQLLHSGKVSGNIKALHEEIKDNPDPEEPNLDYGLNDTKDISHEEVNIDNNPY